MSEGRYYEGSFSFSSPVSKSVFDQNTSDPFGENGLGLLFDLIENTKNQVAGLVTSDQNNEASRSVFWRRLSVIEKYLKENQIFCKGEVISDYKTGVENPEVIRYDQKKQEFYDCNSDGSLNGYVKSLEI